MHASTRVVAVRGSALASFQIVQRHLVWMLTKLTAMHTTTRAILADARDFLAATGFCWRTT